MSSSTFPHITRTGREQEGPIYSFCSMRKYNSSIFNILLTIIMINQMLLILAKQSRVRLLTSFVFINLKFNESFCLQRATFNCNQQSQKLINVNPKQPISLANNTTRHRNFYHNLAKDNRQTEPNSYAQIFAN